MHSFVNKLYIIIKYIYILVFKHENNILIINNFNSINIIRSNLNIYLIIIIF